MNSSRLVHLILRAAGGFRRKPWLHAMSLITLTAAFISFAASLTAAINLDHIIHRWIGNAEITVFVREGTGDAELTQLAGAIEQIPGVARVEMVNAELAMKRFKNQVGEIAESLPDGLFPSSLDIHLETATSQSRKARSELAERLEKVGVVENVELYDDWFNNLFTLSLAGGVVAWGLGFIALVVALLVIASVVRTGINSRAREIEVMKLVGATKQYTNAPFLLEGAFLSCVAMLAALIGVELLTDATADHAGDFLRIVGIAELSTLTARTTLSLIVGASLLGCIGAQLSLRGPRGD